MTNINAFMLWVGKERGQEGIPGIPGRDLSREETEAAGGEAALLATGLWIKAGSGAKPAPARSGRAYDPAPDLSESESED